MLVLNDITIGFRDNERWCGPPDVPRDDAYEVEFIYKGYISGVGFEFEVKTTLFRNVSRNVDPFRVRRDDIPPVFITPTHIYLDKREVQHLYQDTTEFYKHFIMNNINECFVEVYAGGGAGYDNQGRA